MVIQIIIVSLLQPKNWADLGFIPHLNPTGLRLRALGV